MNSNVIILNGNASLRMLDESVFMWTVPYPQDGRIYFTEAYRIESSLSDDNGLNGCVYSVMGRKFQDLSFAEGKTIQVLEAHGDKKYALREYSDGRKFLFVYESVPIFDSFDREWGSTKYSAFYADNNGINLIHSYCGYKLGSVEIYLGLTKSVPALNEYLKYLYVQ